MTKQKKYHFIYRTTCLITDKFYVGMHSTDNLDDGYLGSGKILGYSRKKYGDENHTLEILEYCSSREELKLREKAIVNEELLSNPLNINLKYGGDGGWDHVTKTKSNLTSVKFQEYKNSGRLIQSALKASQSSANRSHQKKSESAIKGWSTRSEEARKNFLIEMTKRASTVSAIEKRKATYAIRNHMKGEKNSQFGSCWVIKDVKPIKIKKEQLDEYLVNGYRRGRK